MNQRIFILFEYCAIAAIFLLLCPPAQAYVHLVYGSLFVQCFLSLFLSAIVITGRSVMAIIGRKAKLANNSEIHKPAPTHSISLEYQ